MVSFSLSHVHFMKFVAIETYIMLTKISKILMFKNQFGIGGKSLSGSFGHPYAQVIQRKPQAARPHMTHARQHRQHSSACMMGKN